MWQTIKGGIMRVEVKKDEVRVYGDNFSGTHIKIYCNDKVKGEDYYSMSIVHDILEHGCLPSVTVSKSDVIIQNNLEKGRRLL